MSENKCGYLGGNPCQDVSERDMRIAKLEAELSAMKSASNMYVLRKGYEDTPEGCVLSMQHDIAALEAENKRLTTSYGKELKDAREFAAKTSKENKRLQSELDKVQRAVTMVACVKGCGKGVRARNAVNGMCPECAEMEIERLREALEKADTVIRGVWNSPLIVTTAKRVMQEKFIAYGEAREALKGFTDCPERS